MIGRVAKQLCHFLIGMVIRAASKSRNLKCSLRRLIGEFDEWRFVIFDNR